MSSLSSIKNIIAIASGKGGVGKSNTTANLGLVLKSLGYQVGILDADIYGPSIPKLLGTTTTTSLKRSEDARIIPVVAHGIQIMSIAYLIEESVAAIWRGPMASRALQQLLYHTKWKTLDYLLIDLPPGTGDIPLTLSQKLPLTGVLMITTPQTIAIADVKKSIAMFQKVKVPILGIIENMSGYHCPHCGVEDLIFGSGGADQLEEIYHIPVLGRLPLDTFIREKADQGKPIDISTTSQYTLTYTAIAKKVSQLVKQKKHRALPTIKIE